MATLKTGLLSVLLVNLMNCLFQRVSPGIPAPPSPPDCYIPCDDTKCSVHLNCTWDSVQDPQIPTNYSLHWESANSKEELTATRISFDGVILRQHFSSHDELRVWVQANNQYGSVKSEEVVFNPADMIKPPPPKVISHYELFEIYWHSCGQQLVETCDVRYRTEADQVWHEDEGYNGGSYVLENPQNCTAYEIQVRCACDASLTSDWSVLHRIQGIAMAPVGELDLWMDCETSRDGLGCVLTWKTLPKNQACGHILGYEIRLRYRNGSAALVNVSTAEPQDLLVCNEMQCHFTSSIKDTSSVSVSAYNAHGATMPSYLSLTVTDKQENDETLRIKINPENLTASWDLPSQLSDSLKEYVVQYKQAGSPPGQAIDWVKLNKSQTRAIFTGQFTKYKPYQVSLFTVSCNGEVSLLSSVIAYSLQGVPSRVPAFKVTSIAATHVTLCWETIPLSEQNGVILYYQIGVDKKENVYNVSALPQHESKTVMQLQHLSPGQQYEVWIRAVTAGGPGERTTTRFKTKDHEHFGYKSIFAICCAVIICTFIVGVCYCHKKSKMCLLLSPCYCDKVPDPHNSHIIREIKQQINDPMSWICIPVEPHPPISLLEVVLIHPSFEKKSDADGLTTPVLRDGSSQMDCQDDQKENAITEDCHRTDQKCGREAYSKMVDSDEERSWSSSEEEQFTSGYEKHFMPTAAEIEVA